MMEELAVTRLWMGGVVVMMLVFAGIAFVGVLLEKQEEKHD
ncbi:hypothetical protein [Pseudomaricurvus alkylphenolicus]|jgi:hypothetical protein|nr:hypothetical protein [Pseudomaricurvus alkylphenolicus]